MLFLVFFITYGNKIKLWSMVIAISVNIEKYIENINN